MMEFTHFNINSSFEIINKRNVVLPQSSKSDKLYIKNVLNHEIISDEWYPIISLTKNLKDLQYPRSLDILVKLSSDGFWEKNVQYFVKHCVKIKVCIRDLYLITLFDHDWLNASDTISEKEVTEIFNNSYFNHDDAIWIDNVPVCFYPSKNFNVLRFVEKDSIIDTRFAIYNNKRLLFLRRNDISYYNFENIISLDIPQFEEPIYDFKEVKKDDIFTFLLDRHIVNALLELDKNNFYMPPLNNDERGGKRFLFTSKNLADYFFIQLYKKLSNPNFKKVNDLFRYNKFEPLETFFKNHYDIPYVDKTNKEFSLYTLVAYLQVSETEEALSIQDESYKFRDGECILFKQNNKHEGKTFLSKDKIFLRTDLIFHTKKMKTRNDSNYLSYLFNEACYLSLKSFHYRELQVYAIEEFNHYNNVLHNKVYQRKSYKYFQYRSLKQPLSYLTNGNFYIFCWNKNQEPNKETLMPYIRAILEDYFTNDPVYVDIVESNCYVDDFDSIKTFLKEDVVSKCPGLTEGSTINHVCALGYSSYEHGLYCKCCFKKFDHGWHCNCDNIEFLQDVVCCKRCCEYLNEKFDEKRSQPYLLKLDNCIIDSQFDISNVRVVGDKIYFRNKQNFHYAQAYHCSCDCNTYNPSDEWVTNIAAKTCRKKKKIVNTFISFSIVDNTIIFSFDLFKNNVTFQEIEKYALYDRASKN